MFRPWIVGYSYRDRIGSPCPVGVAIVPRRRSGRSALPRLQDVPTNRISASPGSYPPGLGAAESSRLAVLPAMTCSRQPPRFSLRLPTIRNEVMATLKERILTLMAEEPGLTDQELADHIFGPGARQQSVNQAARALAAGGRLDRRRRGDGKLGNYLNSQVSLPLKKADLPPVYQGEPDMLSEDEVKRKLQARLEASGWRVKVF